MKFWISQLIFAVVVIFVVLPLARNYQQTVAVEEAKKSPQFFQYTSVSGAVVKWPVYPNESSRMGRVMVEYKVGKNSPFRRPYVACLRSDELKIGDEVDIECFEHIEGGGNYFVSFAWRKK